MWLIKVHSFSVSKSTLPIFSVCAQFTFVPYNQIVILLSIIDCLDDRDLHTFLMRLHFSFLTFFYQFNVRKLESILNLFLLLSIKYQSISFFTRWQETSCSNERNFITRGIITTGKYKIQCIQQPLMYISHVLLHYFIGIDGIVKNYLQQTRKDILYTHLESR